MSTIRRWVGVLIITVGVISLGQVLRIPLISFFRWWPVFLLIPGFGLFGRRSIGPFGINRIVASILTVLGLYFFFEVWTGWTTATVTAWMYPLSVGIGFLLASESDRAHQRVLQILMWACLLAVVIILFTVFALGAYWPYLCIVLGIFIIGKPKRK